MPKIFVGSASESFQAAETVADELQKHHLTPVVWRDSFHLGRNNLDNLLESAGSVDGAVLVCTGDDRTMYRGTEISTTRDDVIFELGLFLSRLGPEKTVIVRGNDATLPEDLAGWEYQLLGEDVRSAASKVATYFQGLFEDDGRSSRHAAPRPFGIRIDPALLERLLDDDLPDDWGHRRLFVGIEGARRWLAVERNHSYWPGRWIDETIDVVNKVIDGLEVRSYVSLGPGIAAADHRAAMVLRKRTHSFAYIPVDISEGLLFHAVKRLNRHVQVPAAILGDYEDGLPYICSELHDVASSPRMLAVLDNNLGNLDRGEEAFLSELWCQMRAGPDDIDYLLLCVALAGDGWDSSKDPLFDFGSYNRDLRSFAAAGVRPLKGQDPGAAGAASPDRVGLRPVSDDSDVDGTRTVHLYDTATGEPLLKLRRYDWAKLLDAVKAWGFEIVAEQAKFDDGHVLGAGAVVLRKRQAG